jgi:hypothetical protein
MSDGYRYGQDIDWGTVNAPQLFTGECINYSYSPRATEQMIRGAAGGNIAMAVHSDQADFRFSAKVTAASTDFLDLSAGAAVAISGIETGIALAADAEEVWRSLTEKTASVSGIHFPFMVQETGTPAAPGTLSAVSPAQDNLDILLPGATLPYSTYSLGHDAGVVYALTLRQSLTIKPDRPSPDGKILGAQAYGYMRSISLELVADKLSAPPAIRSVLAITNAPTHATGYIVTGAGTIWETETEKMFSVRASWIAALVVQ